MMEQPVRHHDAVFETTLSGLEAGLKVRHIATYDLITCQSDEPVPTVFGQRVPGSIDQVPVVDAGRVIGVLERRDPLPDGPVSQHMRYLDGSILVSGDEPLTRFLLETFQGSYRIVIDGAQINGIVTWADVLKLPVRLLAFTLVTHLESIMAQIITDRFPEEDEWLPLLSDDKQKDLLAVLEKRRAENLDPYLFEMTSFSDKATIVRKSLKPSTQFKSDMFKIQDLRNSVAHARDYAEDDQSLDTFRERLRLTHFWISELTKHIEGGDGTSD